MNVRFCRRQSGSLEPLLACPVSRRLSRPSGRLSLSMGPCNPEPLQSVSRGLEEVLCAGIELRQVRSASVADQGNRRAQGRRSPVPGYDTGRRSGVAGTGGN